MKAPAAEKHPRDPGRRGLGLIQLWRVYVSVIIGHTMVSHENIPTSLLYKYFDEQLIKVKILWSQLLKYDIFWFLKIFGLLKTRHFSSSCSCNLGLWETLMEKLTFLPIFWHLIDKTTDQLIEKRVKRFLLAVKSWDKKTYFKEPSLLYSHRLKP